MNDFVLHLLELRDRVLKSVIGFLITFLCLVPFANEIYNILATPLLLSLPAGGQMIATEVTTPFLVPLKIAMLAAFTISAPFTLYQIWAFIAPALYANEKHLISPLVISSFLLFLLGMVFAYYLVFPVVFNFMSSSAPEGVTVMTDIGKYLDFSIALFIAFSLAFQVPVAVILLITSKAVEINTLRKARSYVIVGAFVLGAIVTPPDIISQFMLAIPVWLLFEAGLLVSSILQNKTRQVEA